MALCTSLFPSGFRHGVDMTLHYSGSLIHAVPLLLAPLAAHISRFSSLCPPHFLSLRCSPSCLLQTQSSVNGTLVATLCTMPDAYGLRLDPSPPKATAQIKKLYSSLPSFSQSLFFSPALLPGIKHSSTLCCVKSTLHKILNIGPPRLQPFVPCRLYIHARPVYIRGYTALLTDEGFFIAASVTAVRSHKGASFAGQQPPSGANGAITED